MKTNFKIHAVYKFYLIHASSHCHESMVLTTFDLDKSHNI